ncbi:MAG: 30S ribosomal protein S20 [Gemmatimonadota bacterium]|nr:30S ribosomal protein S20 [Gemmatimonadota bacterium]MDE3006633.1 30S ribosomal protein S20 [Gemmatimonadota bacterium]MDE3014523.1 30S ribosomal protein S20 [Gemmatimonadota bacterium]
MPNIKSAQKRMELSAAARLKNRAERSRIRSAIKKVRSAESAADGSASLTEAVALLDRAATRRLYHPNRVARIKSNLARHVNSLA